MKPYYEEDGIQLFLGDCLEILPELPKVDLVVTDPPYGLGKRMQGGTWGACEKYRDMRNWDKVILQEAVDCAIAKAITAIIWGGNYYQVPPSRCWLAWFKPDSPPTMSDMELAWTNVDSTAKMFRYPVGAYSCERTGHPTQKPLALFNWCLRFAPDAQTILDPFCGSGTTLVAAKNLGRKAIGIELEEKYCEIAVNRLRQGVLAL